MFLPDPRFGVLTISYARADDLFGLGFTLENIIDMCRENTEGGINGFQSFHSVLEIKKTADFVAKDSNDAEYEYTCRYGCKNGNSSGFEVR